MLKKIAQTKQLKDTVSLVSFSVILILFFIFSGNKYFQLNTSFWTNNNFTNPNSTLFTSASRNLFSVEYRYLAIIVLLILVIKFGYKVYKEYIKTKNIYQKSSDKLDLNLSSLSYSILIVFICLAAGLQDISTTIFVLFSSFIGARLIMSDYKEKIDKLGSIRFFGILLILTSWLSVIIYSIGTLVYGGVRSTWYVYVLDLIGLIYLGLLVMSSSRHAKKRKNKEFINYYTDLLLKVGFFIVLLVGIH